MNAGHSPYDGDTNGNMADTAISSPQSDNDRSRTSKPSSQKSMLSRALQQANTAVVLDNAQDFDRAIEAYADACHLLQQVMRGKTGPEDRRKLEAIVGPSQFVKILLTVIAQNLYQTNKRTANTRSRHGQRTAS